MTGQTSASLLASTYDAGICPNPFDELTAIMLDEALGGDRAYFRIHGYHADIFRDSILETLPTGWRNRLVPVPETLAAMALDPPDLAAVKLLVGRPKETWHGSVIFTGCPCLNRRLSASGSSFCGFQPS